MKANSTNQELMDAFEAGNNAGEGFGAGEEKDTPSEAADREEYVTLRSIWDGTNCPGEPVFCEDGRKSLINGVTPQYSHMGSSNILDTEGSTDMRKTELENCPEWLMQATTENENVEIIDGCVIWQGGTWQGGTWQGGTWQGGTWWGGTWRGGTVRDCKVTRIQTCTFCDNYPKTLCLTVGNQAMILAGCRWLTIPQAYTHWSGKPDRITTLAMLDGIKALAIAWGR